jgi:hypothetical protein
MPKGLPPATNTLEAARTGAAPIGTCVIYPDDRMKQGQSPTTGYPTADRWWARASGVPRVRQPAQGPSGPGAWDPERPASRSWVDLLVALLSAVWFVVALPFRLVFWVIAWLGRLTGVVIGFLLMVVGMALWAGPFFIVGIPLFIIGLVLTLRCLEH